MSLYKGLALLWIFRRNTFGKNAKMRQQGPIVLFHFFELKILLHCWTSRTAIIQGAEWSKTEWIVQVLIEVLVLYTVMSNQKQILIQGGNTQRACFLYYVLWLLHTYTRCYSNLATIALWQVQEGYEIKKLLIKSTTWGRCFFFKIWKKCAPSSCVCPCQAGWGVRLRPSTEGELLHSAISRQPDSGHAGVSKQMFAALLRLCMDTNSAGESWQEPILFSFCGSASSACHPCHTHQKKKTVLVKHCAVHHITVQVVWGRLAQPEGLSNRPQ